MKKIYLFSSLVLFIFNSFAQKSTLHLKSEKISINSDINMLNIYENYHFMVFSHIPTDKIKEK